MARPGSIVNKTCYYCLCRYCTRVQCPRGKYHCLPCYHGQILDCDFFQHKKIAKYFRIVKRSPAIHAENLIKLRDTINDILNDQPVIDIDYTGSIHDQIKREELRHKQELRRIIELSKQEK